MKTLLLLILLLIPFASPAWGAAVFTEDFEANDSAGTDYDTGDFTEVAAGNGGNWSTTVGASTISANATSICGVGSESYYIDLATSDAYSRNDFDSSYTDYWIGFNVEITSEGLANDQAEDLVQVRNGSDISASVRLFQTGDALYFRFHTTDGVIANSNSAISIGTTYWVEFHINSTTEAYEWRIDGVSEDSGTGTAIIEMDRIILGNYFDADLAVEYYIDNFILEDATYPTDPCEAGATTTTTTTSTTTTSTTTNTNPTTTTTTTLGSGSTYYIREDGDIDVGANKASATSCSATATALSVTGHNDATFSGNDIIKFCNEGGTITGTVVPPSSGTEGNVITYTAENAVVFQPTSNSPFNTEDNAVSYVTLDGTAGGGTITMNADTTPTTAGYSLKFLNFRDSSNIVIKNLTLDGTGGRGVRDFYIAIGVGNDGGNNITVQYNDIHDWGIGIQVANNADQVMTGNISWNVIDDIDDYEGSPGGDEDGIVLGLGGTELNGDGSGFVVEYNIITDCIDDGIDSFWTHGATIRYNEVGPFGSGTANGIKTGGNTSANNTYNSGRATVYGNYIHGVTNRCITTNGDAGGDIIYANLCVTPDSDGIIINNTGPNAWSGSSVSYTEGYSAIYHNGQLYGCKGTHVSGASTEPGVGGSWETVWTLRDSDTHVYNNTIVCGVNTDEGIDTYENRFGTIYLRNNIVEGSCGNPDIHVTADAHVPVVGSTNMVEDASVTDNSGTNCSGSACYSGTGDEQADALLEANYTLDGQSPARDSGTYISAYDQVLCPTSDTSDWVNTVSLCPNTASDGLGEIGAFMDGKWGGD